MKLRVTISILLLGLSSTIRADGPAPFVPAKHPDYHSLGGDPEQWEYQEPSRRAPDANLGLRNAPDRKIHHVLRTRDSVIWDVTMTHDSTGNRIVPQAGLARRRQFLAFFGCSFVYGDGLDDENTLPATVAQSMNSYHVYNFGIGGTAANTMLAQLQDPSIHKIVKERAGVVIYVLLDAHIARVNDFYQESSWLSDSPDYEYDRNGHLQRAGSYRTAHPWRTKFYDSLRTLQSRFFPNLEFNLPPITQSSYEHLCDLTAAAARESAIQFPGSKFIVVNHPRNAARPEVIACLKSRGLTVLTPEMDDNADYSFKNEGHPTAKFNRDFAPVLASQLLSHLR